MEVMITTKMVTVTEIDIFFILVASYGDHPGDRWISGEEARRPECPLHPSTYAGLPGNGSESTSVI